MEIEHNNIIMRLNNSIDKLFTNRFAWQYQEGIIVPVCNNEPVDTVFNSDMQEELFDIEDTSWWFQYRSIVIQNLINKFFDYGELICDIGGGNGYTTKVLQDNEYEVVLLEPSLTACQNGYKRGITNVICGTFNDEDFQDNSIENCCLLDVLEHIENDADFLQLIYRKLSSKGKILITVPALKCLWSSEDDIAGHFRRYSKKELESLFVHNGFKILYCNYFFSFLVAPIFLFRALKDKSNKKKSNKKPIDNTNINHHKSSNRVISLILGLIEKTEMKYLMMNWKVVLGSSIILIAKK